MLTNRSRPKRFSGRSSEAKNQALFSMGNSNIFKKQTSAEISSRMRAVKSKDSKIEIALRKAMWNAGYRYRKHYKNLPGTPDIVLVKYKIAIFCDSEFWHGKDWERRKKDFKSNQEFWLQKIERNMERDREVDEKLRALGWRSLRFWGRKILRTPDECLAILNELVRKDG